MFVSFLKSTCLYKLFCFDELVKEYSISSIMIEMSEEKIKKPKEYINDIIYKPISKEAIDNLVENYLNGKGVM